MHRLKRDYPYQILTTGQIFFLKNKLVPKQVQELAKSPKPFILSVRLLRVRSLLLEKVTLRGKKYGK